MAQKSDKRSDVDTDPIRQGPTEQEEKVEVYDQPKGGGGISAGVTVLIIIVLILLALVLFTDWL